MKELLLFIFTKILLRVKSKKVLSLLFSLVAAILSAFLDALTVTAVLISVGVGFFTVYHKVASGTVFDDAQHDHTTDNTVKAENEADLEQFRAFLRSLLMHGAVGTALGGVCTLVGEPQNLLIATVADWDFVEFFLLMAPITMPVLVAGLLTCLILEQTGIFGYGAQLPPKVERYWKNSRLRKTRRQHLFRMPACHSSTMAVVLVVGLALHWRGWFDRIDDHCPSDCIQWHR